MNNNRSPVMTVGLTLFGIGGVFVMIGLGLATWSVFSATGKTPTEGTVVRMERGGKGSKPVVKYEVDGQDYEVRGLLTTSPPAHSVGDKVAVLYQPQTPSEAVIDTFINRWLFPTIFGGIGAIFALIGAGMLVARNTSGP